MAQDTVYEDLVLSMLAINNHPIERVYPLREAMRSEGLFDALDPKNTDPATITARFMAAGYDRRPYMNAILAERLQQFALFTQVGGLDQVRALLRAGRRKDVDALLSARRGIGPAVLKNFWLLQGEELDEA